MFDTPRSAGHFMQALTESGIPCQYGKETPHLKQKALEDPHSSNLYVAEIPLDATEEVGGCVPMNVANPAGHAQLVPPWCHLITPFPDRRQG